MSGTTESGVAGRGGGRRWLVPGVAVVVLVVLVLAMSGVFRRGRIAPGRLPAAPSVEVPGREGRALLDRRPVFHRAVGTVVPRVRVDLAAQVTGRVLSVAADVGDAVSEGDDLVRLDDREARARLEQARSALSGALAEQEQARLNHDRVERLAAEGAATAEQREGSDARKKRAEAAVVGAEQAVAEAEAGLAYTRMEAPLSGVVAARDVEPGDLAWPGRVLMELQDPRELRLRANLREGLAREVAVGREVEVSIGAVGAVVRGPIVEIRPNADPMSRSFGVEVELPPTPGVAPGMFGELRLPTGEREVVVVPEAALDRVGQLSTVRVKTADGWVRRYVTPGQAGGGEIEVLSGLSGGEVIGWDERD